MIASADGGTAVGGLSGGLGSAGDKDVFGTLRGISDVILAGAATVRQEGYGPPSTSVSSRARRLGHGATPIARIAVVSGSLDLDLGGELFTSKASRPIVITHTRSDPARRAAAAAVADVVVAGDEHVDMGDALAALAGLGARTVLCEGGPMLNGQLFAADLVDEICITVAPVLLAGLSRRLAVGPPDARSPLVLEHVLTEDHYLFLRYTVDRSNGMDDRLVGDR